MLTYYGIFLYGVILFGPRMLKIYSYFCEQTKYRFSMWLPLQILEIVPTLMVFSCVTKYSKREAGSKIYHQHIMLKGEYVKSTKTTCKFENHPPFLEAKHQSKKQSLKKCLCQRDGKQERNSQRTCNCLWLVSKSSIATSVFGGGAGYL